MGIWAPSSLAWIYANSLLTGLPVFHPPPPSLPTTARGSLLKWCQRMSLLCSKLSTGSHCAQTKTQVLTMTYQTLHEPTPSMLRPRLLHHSYSLALLLCLRPASALLQLLFLLPTMDINPPTSFRPLAPEGYFLQVTPKKAPFLRSCLIALLPRA